MDVVLIYRRVRVIDIIIKGWKGDWIMGFIIVFEVFGYSIIVVF